MNRTQVSAIALGLAVAGSTVAVALGAPTWLLLGTSALPLGFIVARRWGGLVAVPVLLIGFSWLLLVVMMGTRLLSIPMLPAFISIWTVLGLIGAVSLGRRSAWPARTPADLAVWVPAALGGVLWIAVQATAVLLPGAARLVWSMQGDSANNVIFAREIIYANGITVGPGELPVPLPNALMALVMSAGRSGVEANMLLEHDVLAFAQVWSLQIGLLCLTCGAAAAAIVRAAGGGVRYVSAVGAIVSLLPLSWFYTGYPMEFGFFGVHVAMPIVLAAFVAFLGSERHPVLAVALQMLAATLLLAVWSPLVLMPMALGAVVVIRAWRALLRARGLPLAGLIVALGQLAAYGFAVVLPSLVALSGALTSLGGVVRFRSWMLPAVLITVVVGAVVVGWRRSPLVFWGPLALGLASAVGVGALLYVSRDAPDPWTYYPLKLAWVATALMLPIALGLGMALIVRFHLFKIRAGGLAALLAAVAVFSQIAPTTSNGQQRQHPFVRILAGTVQGRGDDVARQIFSLADLEQPRLLWRSDREDEGFINFWLLEVTANSMKDKHTLRQFAYDAFRLTDVDDLCAIVDLIDSPVEVLTADPLLELEIPTDCRSRVREVVLEKTG